MGYHCGWRCWSQLFICRCTYFTQGRFVNSVQCIVSVQYIFLPAKIEKAYNLLSKIIRSFFLIKCLMHLLYALFCDSRTYFASEDRAIVQILLDITTAEQQQVPYFFIERMLSLSQSVNFKASGMASLLLSYSKKVYS